MATPRELVLRLLITARDTASGGLDRVRGSVEGIRESAAQALAPLRSFAALITAAIGVGGAKEIIDRADAYTRLSNSLKVATQSEMERLAAEQEVARIAKDTRSDLETTAQLYARINQNRKAMNITERETASLTELISKGMQLGGASAQEYASATLQLTQAFGSGALRGEEFNAVVEASPELMRKLADGLGLAVGELRGLAEQGALTSSVVVRALLSQKDAIDEAYGKTIPTVEQALVRLNNEAVLFVGKLNEQTGATQALGAGLVFLAKNLDAVASVMGAAFAASAAKAVQSTTQFVTASVAAREAARQQAIAAEQQRVAALASAQGQVAAAQAAYNRALAEQRLAAQIVALMQAELGYGVTENELAAARTRAAAAATSATVATERYAAAQAALNAIQAPAAASAGIFARSLAFLAGPGGLILTAVASFGLLYAAFARQKQPTEELTQSVEQYSESLKKMSAAQARASLDAMNRALEEQKQKAEEARQAYEQVAQGQKDWLVITDDLGPVLGKVNRVISDSSEIARIRTERQAALDTATQQLADTEARRAIALEDVTRKEALAGDETAKHLAALAQMQLAMEKYIQRSQEVGQQQKDISDATLGRIAAETDLARINGDLQRVEALSIEQAREKARAAESQAKLDRDIALAAQMKLSALKDELQQYQTLTPVQLKNLQNAEAEAKIKAAQSDASRALAAQLAGQARQTEAANSAQQAMLDLGGRVVAAQLEAIDAGIRETRAALELAKAKGDEATARKLNAQLQQQEADAGQIVLQQHENELQKLRLKRQQIIDTAGGYEKLTAAQRLEIAQIDLLVSGKQKDIAASQQQIANSQREADQAERMAGPIGQLIRLYDQKAAAAARETDAVERSYDAKLRDLEVERQQAIAKGDTAREAEISIKMKEVEAEKAQAVADAKKAELQAEIDLLEAKKLDVLASDLSAKAKAEELAQIDAKIAKLRDLQDAEQDHADKAKAEAETAKRSAETLQAQAAAAADAERETRRMATVIGYAAQNFGELSEKGQAALKAINTDPMARATKDAESLNRAVGQLAQGLDSAAGTEIQFNRNLQALVETASGIGPEADRARRELVFMAEQGVRGIAGITRSGEEAVRTLDDIKNTALEAKDALSGLADDYEKQILQIQGDKKTLEQLDYEDQLRKLEELRQKSGQEGQREFEEAKARADELHRLKLKQLADEENAKARQQREGTTTVRPSGGGGGSGGAGTSGPVNVTVNVPNAMLVDDRTADAVARRLKPVFDGINRRLA